MKQVRLYGVQDLRIDDVPRPAPGPRDVLVKVDTFGICGSDLNFAHVGGIGRLTEQPVPLGHELAGILAEVGAEVRDLTVGQRVVVDPAEGGNRIGIGALEEGGFAEYLLVRNAGLNRNIYLIPDSLPFKYAALVEPIAVGMHGINLGEARAGDRAVVYGAGPIGLGAVASLKYRKAAKIVAVDVVDERLERARQLGADVLINPTQVNLRQELEKLFGVVTASATGALTVDCDLYIDAAGVGVLLSDTIDMAKDGSRIVVLARHKEPLAMDLVQVMAKELVVRGSLAYANEFEEVLAMLNDPGMDISPMVSHIFSFDQFQEAFRTARDAKQSAKVLVHVD